MANNKRSMVGWALVALGVLVVLAVFSGSGQQADQGGSAVVGVVLLGAGWLLVRKGKAKRAQETVRMAKPGDYSTKQCPECEETLPLEAEFCSSCGKKQKEGVSTCGAGIFNETEAKKSFAEARKTAKYAGGTHYIWRTSQDGDVCERCRLNEGKKFSWDVEPKGGHAGARARCRCYPEPIIPGVK